MANGQNKKNIAAAAAILSPLVLVGWEMYRVGEMLDVIHAPIYGHYKYDLCDGIEKALSPRSKVDITKVVKDYVSRKGGQVLVKDAKELYYLMLEEKPRQDCYHNATLRREFVETMKDFYPQITDHLGRNATDHDAVILRVEGSRLEVRNTLYL